MAEESEVLNSLVAGYLSKVSPGIAKKFKSLHSSPTVPISLREVLDHFNKTAPPKRKLSLGINEGPSSKKAKQKEEDTEDSESDSSGEELGENEVEISLCREIIEGLHLVQSGHFQKWTHCR